MKGTARPAETANSTTWRGSVPPPHRRRLRAADRARVLRRGIPLAFAIFGGLGVLLLVRLAERPLFGTRRPVTPWITQAVCISAFWWLGLGRTVPGRRMAGRGALVAHPASWLDILALNASDRVNFVAKADVARWPGIGWLAKATGTLFIRRDRTEAAAQTAVVVARLAAGQRLLFFPEGTSTDGLRVLPFKPTLFAAFFDPRLKDELRIQPVTVRYVAPAGADRRLYGWWGDMEFADHLLQVLAAPRQGRVEVIHHAPVAVAGTSGRKALAAACEAEVRKGLDHGTPVD